MKQLQGRVAIVTGGSSGIGRETAAALCALGCTVYEFSRHGAGGEGVRHIRADVTDDEQVLAAVQKVFDAQGRIDILVANAGFGISGAAEFTSTEDAKRQLDVNLFGASRACRAVIPFMRQGVGGRIVLISSVAAAIPIPYQAWYSVSKAAIAAYAQALRVELAPFGISVAYIMPGDIASGFTAARGKLAEGDDIYGGRISRSIAVMEHDETHGMTCALAGRFIARACCRRNPPPAMTIGLKYKLFIFLLRLLPVRFVSYVIGKMYGG